MTHPRMAATLLASAAIMGLAPLAQADTNYQGYNVVVPKHGGTTYTSGQRKAVTDASADLRSQSVGDGKEVEVCVTVDGSHVCAMSPWVKIRSNQTHRLGNSVHSGNITKIRFSSYLTDWVDIRATGTWRAN